jgi:hypothetical protein
MGCNLHHHTAHHTAVSHKSVSMVIITRVCMCGAHRRCATRWRRSTSSGTTTQSSSWLHTSRQQRTRQWQTWRHSSAGGPGGTALPAVTVAWQSSNASVARLAAEQHTIAVYGQQCTMSAVWQSPTAERYCRCKPDSLHSCCCDLPAGAGSSMRPHTAATSNSSHARLLLLMHSANRMQHSGEGTQRSA